MAFILIFVSDIIALGRTLLVCSHSGGSLSGACTKHLGMFDTMLTFVKFGKSKEFP